MRNHAFFLALLVVVWSQGATGRGEPELLDPRSTIASVELEGFVPDGRHCSAIVYLSGNFSTSYYVPESLPNPTALVTDGYTTEKEIFALAEEALRVSKADEIDMPTRKELDDAAFSNTASKYRGRVVIIISSRKSPAASKAYMRTWDGRFRSKKLRALDELVMEMCDKRLR